MFLEMSHLSSGFQRGRMGAEWSLDTITVNGVVIQVDGRDTEIKETWRCTKDAPTQGQDASSSSHEGQSYTAEVTEPPPIPAEEQEAAAVPQTAAQAAASADPKADTGSTEEIERDESPPSKRARTPSQ